MKPDLILKSDLLDIIFENRNKEYGAYELRNHYADRLMKSLGLILLAVVLMVGASYLKTNHFRDSKNGGGVIVGDSIKITPVVISPTQPMALIPPNKLATTKNVPYLIVKDKDILKTIVPTQEEMQIKNIGTDNIEGEPPGEQLQNNAGANGSATPELKTEPEKEVVLKASEIMPEFPGGVAALQRFLARNLKTPDESLETGSNVRVLVHFIVYKDGTVTGIEVEQTGGKAFDNEVLRVIKKMPAWKPGSQNGKNVSVYFKIPVVFQLEEGN